MKTKYLLLLLIFIFLSFQGIELLAVVDTASCAYDKQMCPVEPDSKMAKLTNNLEITGDALRSNLNNNDFEFNDSLYPMLKNMPTTPPFVAARYVAAAPAFLRINSDTDYDTYDNVRYCFRVSNQNGVKWRSKNGYVEIIESSTGSTSNVVNLLEKGWDTLVAYIEVSGDYDYEIHKEIPINITALNNDCYITPPFTLTLFTNPDNIGSTIGSGNYSPNTNVPIEAISEDCYQFTCWTNSLGDTISYKQIDTITLISDSVLIANFEIINYDLLVLPAKSGEVSEGEVSGSGSFDCGSSNEIMAISNACYKFTCWTNSLGDTISYKQIDTIILLSDSVLFANFEIINFDLFVQTTNGGEVSGDGRFSCGNFNEITATPNTCYEFDNWTDTGGKIISEDANYTFTIISDTTLIANFKIINYDLFVQATGGEVSGDGRFNCGSSNEITAISNACYEFENWTDIDGKIISEDANYTFTIISDTTLIANFKIICDKTKFTIQAAKQELVPPQTKNHSIPIFIEAEQDASDYTIDKLIIDIDRNVYFPYPMPSMTKEIIDNITRMTFTNIKVPSLTAGVPVELLTIRGDVLLGDKDSADIHLVSVDFIADLAEDATLVNGYITILICEEGDDRLLTDFGYSPTITITNNPVSEILEVKCKIIEIGDYTLDIIDLAGNSHTIKNWFVNAIDAKDYTFEIPISTYGSGTYILQMRTPTNSIQQKIIIKR